MEFQKLGLLIKPNTSYAWMSEYCGPSFVEVYGNELIVYMQTRGKNNISKISKIILDETFNIISVDKPLLNEGSIGCFDESGVSYPWIVDTKDKSLLYYVGWVAGGKGGFQNYIGLAISHDNKKTFQRISKAPILDRTNEEPLGHGSVAVLYDEGIYKMWYTSFVRWEIENNSIKHYYHIKYTESDDGINWHRENIICIHFEDAKEYAIAKPFVIKEKGLYKMWYSYRGDYYKIGYAESLDGISWTRKDHLITFDKSENGWDSDMVEYGYIFDFKGERYMTYNGNGYGKSGLGLARLIL